jgi:hypothetical protein
MENNVLVDGGLHIPYGLVLSARKVSNGTNLFVGDVGYAKELESDGKVDRQHQPDVAVQLRRVGSVQDQLADNTKRNCIKWLVYV